MPRKASVLDSGAAARSVDEWAARVAAAVVRDMGAGRGIALESLTDPAITMERLVALARMAYLEGNDAQQMQLRGDVLAGRGPRLDLLAAMLAADFGFVIEFLARVRRVWFHERGGRPDKGAPGSRNLWVEFGGPAPKHRRRLVRGGVSTARHFMRYPSWVAWEREAKRDHLDRSEYLKDRYGFDVDPTAFKNAFKGWRPAG